MPTFKKPLEWMGSSHKDLMALPADVRRLFGFALSLAQSGMRLSQHPYRPTVFELHRNGRLFPPNYLHESWMDYLYWDTELDP